MNDKQIIQYVKDMIVDNLFKRGFIEEVVFINSDKTNKTLIEYINVIIKIFQKAKEILEDNEKIRRVINNE